MASKWRIDGVFWTCALKKLEQVFTSVGFLVAYLYSMRRWSSIQLQPRPIGLNFGAWLVRDNALIAYATRATQVS